MASVASVVKVKHSNWIMATQLSILIHCLGKTSCSLVIATQLTLPQMCCVTRDLNLDVCVQGTYEDNEISGNALAGVWVKNYASPVMRRSHVHHGRDVGVFVFDNGSVSYSFYSKNIMVE